jgi:hypothetical protein
MSPAVDITDLDPKPEIGDEFVDGNFVKPILKNETSDI